MYQSLLPTRYLPQMQWQIHLNLHYIIRYITNKVCNVSDKYHIDNGTRISLCQIVFSFQFLLPNLSFDFTLLLLYLSVLALSTL